MSLKPDRHIFQTEINFVCNVVADSGLLMTYDLTSVGSGNGVQDDKAGVVDIGPAVASGVGVQVVGLLVNPFVTFDPLKHRNWYKVTQYPGEKATLLRQGWVTLNNIASGVTPQAGDKAYLAPNGLVSNVATGNVGPKVGEFMSRLDENGYCRLAIHLP